jgi:hypothetical protein
MTAAETIRKLKNSGASDELARGIVEAMEDWERDRVVTREHFDRRLAETEATFERALRGLAFHLWGATLTTIGLTLTGVYFLLAHFKP